jgi:hypothetical protein
MSAQEGAVSVVDKSGRHLDDGSVAQAIIVRAESLGFVREATLGGQHGYDSYLYEDASEAVRFLHDGEDYWKPKPYPRQLVIQGGHPQMTDSESISDPRHPGELIRCPITGQPPDGCGSAHVQWDGIDVYDCLDCGLCFTYAAADKLQS